MVKKNVCCLVERTLEVIGGRWKVLILQQLLDGGRRFSALHRELGGITHKTLTHQLREMEADGVVNRKVYPEIPPRVEYSLTPLGKTLRPVLMSMHHWAAIHAGALKERRLHA